MYISDTVLAFYNDAGNDPGLNAVLEVWPWLTVLLDHENNGILMFYKGRINSVASTQISLQIRPWTPL